MSLFVYKYATSYHIRWWYACILHTCIQHVGSIDSIDGCSCTLCKGETWRDMMMVESVCLSHMKHYVSFTYARRSSNIRWIVVGRTIETFGYLDSFELEYNTSGWQCKTKIFFQKYSVYFLIFSINLWFGFAWFRQSFMCLESPPNLGFVFLKTVQNNFSSSMSNLSRCG